MSDFIMVKCTKCRKDTPLLPMLKICGHCGAVLDDKYLGYFEEAVCQYNWLSLDERSNVPSVINREYDSLMKMIEENNIYGSIFKLRDIFEIIMKIPIIMSLVVVCNNYNKKEATIEDSNMYKEILAAMLSGPLAMGSWQNLMAVTKKNGNQFGLGNSLKNILDQTNRCLNQKIKGYSSVAQWRNETIGHGTLMIGNTDTYWDEVKSLIEVLNNYLRGEYRAKNQKVVNDLYESVYFEVDGLHLQGDNIPEDTQGQHILWNENKAYTITEFMHFEEDKYYFFDSYYSGKKKTKVTDYVSQSKFWEKDGYYKDLYRLYEHMVAETGEVNFDSKFITEYEQRKMDCLNESIEYERPQYIYDAIKRKLLEEEKGIILLQMERGMGKSAFAYDINGAYKNEYYNKELNAVIRTYHLGEVKYQGVGQFYIFPVNAFLKTSTDIGNIQYPADPIFSGYCDNLANHIDIAKSISGMLDYFRKMYIDLASADNDLKIIFVIDGIDELNLDSKEIVSNIPRSEELEKGCYILLTSRLKDESNISEITEEIISDVEKRFGVANSALQFRTNNKEYLASLQNYVKKLSDKIPSLSKRYTKDEYDKVLASAQNIFLYVRPILELGDNLIDGEFSAVEIVERYINRISRMYYGVMAETYELIIASIAVFGKVSIEEISNLILYSEEVTYEVIGIINDISPLLTSRRSGDTTEYEYANEEYRKYILATRRNEVKQVVERLITSIFEWTNIIVENNKWDYGQWQGDDKVDKYARYLICIDKALREELQEIENYSRFLLSSLVVQKCLKNTYQNNSIKKELWKNTINKIEYELEVGNDCPVNARMLGDVIIQFHYEPETIHFLTTLEKHCVINDSEVDNWFDVIFRESRCLYDDSSLRDECGNIINKRKDDIFVQYIIKRNQKLKSNPNYSMLGVMYKIYNSLEASNEDLLKEILLALDKMIRVCNLKTTYDTNRNMVNDILQEAKRNNSIIHTIEYERIIEEIADLLHGGEEFEFFSNEEISFEPNYLKKAVDMIKNWGNSKDEFSNDFETQLTRWAQLFREKIAHSIERSDLSSEVIKFLGKKAWIFGDDYIYVLDAICMGLTQNEKKGYIKTLFNAIEFLGEDKRELTDSIYHIIRYYDERCKDKPNIICKGDRYHICSNQLDDIEERYLENWADLVFVEKYRINEYDSDMRFLSPYMIMHLSNMKKHDKGSYISLCKKVIDSYSAEVLKGFIVNSFSKLFTDYLGWILDLQLERETNIIEYLRDKNILYIAQENLFLLLSQYEYDTLIQDNNAVRRVEKILYLIIEISIVNEKIVETDTATTIKSCIKYLEGIRNSDKEKHIGNWIDEMVNQIKNLNYNYILNNRIFCICNCEAESFD